MPALRATRQISASALRQGGPARSGVARSRLSKVLVVSQVAMSLVLLVGARLFLRTVRNLQTVDLGFQPGEPAAFTLRPASLGYRGAQLEALYDRLFTRLDAFPGCSATFAASGCWAAPEASTDRLARRDGGLPHPSQHNLQIARENYLATMQIPLLLGRGFSAQDRDGAPRVALVNETLARRYFPDGKRSASGWAWTPTSAVQPEIVGIVADSKYTQQRREVGPRWCCRGGNT